MSFAASCFSSSCLVSFAREEMGCVAGGLGHAGPAGASALSALRCLFVGIAPSQPWRRLALLPLWHSGRQSAGAPGDGLPHVVCPWVVCLCVLPRDPLPPD